MLEQLIDGVLMTLRISALDRSLELLQLMVLRLYDFTSRATDHQRSGPADNVQAENPPPPPYPPPQAGQTEEQARHASGYRSFDGTWHETPQVWCVR